MKKLLVAVGLVLGIATIVSSSALAHDPIILTEEQTEPTSGPLIPDGTISFAFYGTVDSAGDTRGFRVTFVEGDRLYLSLLIPDLPPENTLADEQLPSVELVDPTGRSVLLAPDQREPFAEPFSGTNYIRLRDLDSIAMAGEYTVTVIGGAPARFTVSVGFKEVFGTPVEGVANRALGVSGVMDWYATPPPEGSGSTVATSTTQAVVTSSTPATSNDDNDEITGNPSSDSSIAFNWVLLIVVSFATGLAFLIVRSVVKRRRSE